MYVAGPYCVCFCGYVCREGFCCYKLVAAFRGRFSWCFLVDAVGAHGWFCVLMVIVMCVSWEMAWRCIGWKLCFLHLTTVFLNVFVLFFVLTGLTVSNCISLLSVCRILVLARFRFVRCVVCGRGP